MKAGIMAGQGICKQDALDMWCDKKMPCDGKAVGSSCSEAAASILPGQGICKKDSGGMYCAERQPCDGKAVGSSCADKGAGIKLVRASARKTTRECFAIQRM